MANAISKTVNIPPQVPEPADKKPQAQQIQEMENDIDTAQRNIREVIDVTQQGLAELAPIADQSQSAKVYEALAKMASVCLQANKDLLETHQTKRDLQGPQAPTTINNNLFVGSTQDALAMIKKRKQEKADTQE